MLKLKTFCRTKHIVLLIFLVTAFGWLAWETFLAGPQMHKLEQISGEHYRAIAWSREGLQVQLARHDPTNELNPWFTALDIRNKSSNFVLDFCGLRAWKYETDGLVVSIILIPLWLILTAPLGGYFVWMRRRGVQRPVETSSADECRAETVAY